MWPILNESSSFNSIHPVNGSLAAPGKEALCKVIELDRSPLPANNTASVFFALSPDESTLAVAINSRFCFIPVAKVETATAPFSFVDGGADATTKLEFKAPVIHDLAWSPTTPSKLLVAYVNGYASDPAPRISERRLYLSLYTDAGTMEESPISAFSVAQKVSAVCWYADSGNNPPLVVAALSDTSCHLLESAGAAKNEQKLPRYESGKSTTL